MNKSFSQKRKTHALIDAVVKNDARRVKKILEAGVDPNMALDKDGITPLHFAVQYEALDVIPILITAGARLDLQGLGEETPLDIAKYNQNKKIMNLLLPFLAKQDNISNLQ